MVTLTEAPPNSAEYCALRIAAGLSPMNESAATAALPRSLHAVCLRDGERLVGMGRVVGDGLHVQVVDIAVHPDFQGRGLSRLVLDSIVGYLATLPRTTVVSLFADIDWLYGKYGFVEPSASTGMFLRHWPEARDEGAIAECS
jgi:ribosomal protein S18 acetylase RimI-like enzyme